MKDKTFQILSRWSKTIGPFLSKRKYGIFVLVSAWCVADLALISIRPLFLSAKGLPYSPSLNRREKPVNMAKYMPIWDFNIFHNGRIPASLSTAVSQAPQKASMPVLSRLPLQLNGIVIYEDPVYSIASITIKSNNKSGAYRTGDKVEKMANITRIEKERVYFINLSANAEEYIELPRKSHVKTHVTDNRKKTPNITKATYIKQRGNFQFELNRSEVNKRLRNLPNILQEAKVVPHLENGKLTGWRFEYIKKGSIYDHFGLKESDIITSVAGELPPSQIKAIELFHELKNTRSKITAKVKRKGRELPFSWSIKEDVSKEEPPTSRFY